MIAQVLDGRDIFLSHMGNIETNKYIKRNCIA
jgi:hypothetical protein